MKNSIRNALKLALVGALAVGLIALISACSGSSGGSEEAGGHDEVAEHSEGGVTHSDSDEVAVTIRTEDVKFVPDTIRVKVGQTVRMKLDNHDAVIHDYTVDEPHFVVLEANGAQHDDHDVVAAQDDHDDAAGSHEDEDEHEAVADHDDAGGDHDAQVSLVPLHIAAEGEDHAELVFEATEPGEYVVYCSVEGHREAGMEGTIIVEE